jgi:hypothetical protein
MTAVLERDGIEAGRDYVTEPYEVAWAAEARWFVRVLRWPETVTRVELSVEISPDGLHWCSLESAPPCVITGPGIFSWPSDRFGGWLRLRARAAGPETAGTAIPALIYLALKS